MIETVPAVNAEDLGWQLHKRGGDAVDPAPLPAQTTARMTTRNPGCSATPPVGFAVRRPG
ncbi:hypothetical protein ACFV4G_30190 [Kitasatospora sp. NPDC059747]|uniref:hypothetical protein n=1 Tax=Kitasatospora sp. NPDC059747 TaxID=3346930 RepID=UPI0036648A0F